MLQIKGQGLVKEVLVIGSQKPPHIIFLTRADHLFVGREGLLGEAQTAQGAIGGGSQVWQGGNQGAVQVKDNQVKVFNHVNTRGRVWRHRSALTSENSAVFFANPGNWGGRPVRQPPGRRLKWQFRAPSGADSRQYGDRRPLRDAPGQRRGPRRTECAPGGWCGPGRFAPSGRFFGPAPGSSGRWWPPPRWWCWTPRSADARCP